MRHRELGEELFGPSTVIVRCGSRDEMEAVARGLDGQLTATIHGTPADLAEYASLVSILEDKAGRLIVNGFPTGVEVCPSMQHGGPYPATTDSRTTSVGTAAIHRFARPVAYQNFPQSSLPVELQDCEPARHLASGRRRDDEGRLMTIALNIGRLQVVQVYGGTRLRRSHRPDRQRARRSRFDARRRAAHDAAPRTDGPRRRAPAIEPRRTARAPAGPHPVDDAGRVAGGVGRRRDLPQKQGGAHGGIRVQRQRLRPRLRRGASGDLLQVARRRRSSLPATPSGFGATPAGACPNPSSRW